ncbi:ABC transporter transmembrane domain-containing protein [Falsirhodobacter xinxiangensis]|uniref:ABC transporter transmembrane domain-containing protein n=1 Tax=Falsirhodobacter xinxiangensis TaxID=2530049 RepID=UPI0010AB2625|nr:ABC transporter transmembrane domain-containing protein [Rhodobacter xinxiangensis]
MTPLPRITDGGRCSALVFVILLGIAQAASLGAVAFGTRAAFSALHGGIGPGPEVLVTLAAGGIAGALLHLAARVQAERLGQRYVADLRRVLYRHIAGMDAETLQGRRLGMLSMRFVGDLSAAKGWVAMGVTRGLAAVAVLPGAIIAIWLVSPRLAPVALLPLLLAVVVTAAVALGLADRHRGLRRRRAAIAGDMMERIALAPQLDLAGRTAQELDRLAGASRALEAEAASRAARAGLLRALPAMGAALAGVAVLGSAARMGVPAAEVAAMLATLSILMFPLGDLAGVWDRWCAWRIARERCISLLSLPSKARRAQASGAVSLALEGLGSVPPGALAVVSGASPGPALRSAAAQGGAMGVNYGLPPGKLPRIAYISDRAMILRGSLRRALTMGVDPRPHPHAIRKAARQFGLSGLLDRMGSTRSRVAEGGRGLSHTERLAVEMTRAALMRPDLVVIDHPGILPQDPLLARLARATGATILIGQEADGPLRLSLAPPA